MSLRPSGRQRSTIWSWVTSTRSAMMTSTLSSRTWWRPASCFSSVTDKSSTSWNWSHTHPSLLRAQMSVHAEFSHKPVFFHASTFHGTARRSATSATQRKSAISSSVPCIANTSVNCRAFQTVQNRSSAFANCSKICSKCTSQRYVSTWTSWESNRSELLSNGSTLRSWARLRLIKSTYSLTESLVSRRWRFCQSWQLASLFSGQTWFLTARIRRNLMSSSWISARSRSCQSFNTSCSLQALIEPNNERTWPRY